MSHCNFRTLHDILTSCRHSQRGLRLPILLHLDVNLNTSWFPHFQVTLLTRFPFPLSHSVKKTLHVLHCYVFYFKQRLYFFFKPNWNQSSHLIPGVHVAHFYFFLVIFPSSVLYRVKIAWTNLNWRFRIWSNQTLVLCSEAPITHLLLWSKPNWKLRKFTPKKVGVKTPSHWFSPMNISFVSFLVMWFLFISFCKLQPGLSDFAAYQEVVCCLKSSEFLVMKFLTILDHWQGNVYMYTSWRALMQIIICSSTRFVILDQACTSLSSIF